MRVLRPIPRRLSRALSVAFVLAWLGQMGLLAQRAYLQDSAPNLAADLSRYGSAASWKGVYYRGEKIGFTVSQVQVTDDGFELQEDGRLQFSLLGSTTAAILKTTGVRVEMLSPTSAYVTFKWKQTREFDGKLESASGRTTLVFKKTGKEWKAVHLHTSPDNPAPTRPVLESERQRISS